MQASVQVLVTASICVCTAACSHVADAFRTHHETEASVYALPQASVCVVVPEASAPCLPVLLKVTHFASMHSMPSLERMAQATLVSFRRSLHSVSPISPSLPVPSHLYHLTKHVPCTCTMARSLPIPTHQAYLYNVTPPSMPVNPACIISSSLPVPCHEACMFPSHQACLCYFTKPACTISPDVISPYQAVMIGGGYIGMEVASNVVANNLPTTIVMPEDRLMSRLFTPEVRLSPCSCDLSIA